MSALDVVPLATAKGYLNIPAEVTDNDDELTEDFIPPAVERVERWVFGPGATGAPAGHFDPDTISATQRLACRMVLAEYWRTQRMAAGGRQLGAAGASGAALEADSDPAGAAPLRFRLTELLGPAAPGVRPVASGSFPPAAPWPDPAWPDRRAVSL